MPLPGRLPVNLGDTQVNQSKQLSEERGSCGPPPLWPQAWNFPKSLSIESLCPLSFLKVLTILDWQEKMETCPWMEALVAVGRKTFSQVLGGGGTLWAQLEAFTTMFLRHQAVHVTFLTLEKRKPSSIWMTFYSTYMGYSTTSTNGRGHSAFNRRTNQNTEAESTTDTTLPSSLNYDEQSMSDVGTTVSDYDSPGNSVNEEEGGMRERRDSGVGASLTRPSRWVKPFYRVYRKSWPVTLHWVQLALI